MRLRNWLRGARVHVLHVKEGDIVTLTMDGVMTPEQARSIKEQWERKFPDVRCAVMSEGLHPSAVIRPEPPAWADRNAEDPTVTAEWEAAKP